MQASLFVDINAKQKSVKQSLLQELTPNCIGTPKAQQFA